MVSRVRLSRREMLPGYGPTIRFFNACARTAGLVFAVACFGASGPAASAAPPMDASTAAREAIRLLVFGDSLTAGYGLPQGSSFPKQLEAALREAGYNIRVINAGVSGDTTAAGLARLDWTLAGLSDSAPDAAIVELGANDGLRGIDPSTSYDKLDSILERFEREGVPVLLAGMLAPPNMGRAYGDAFQSIYSRLAAEHDVILYPFFLEGVAAVPHLNQDDGIHPNAKGVAVIVQNIMPHVEVLLAKAEADLREGGPAHGASNTPDRQGPRSAIPE